MTYPGEHMLVDAGKKRKRKQVLQKSTLHMSDEIGVRAVTLRD